MEDENGDLKKWVPVLEESDADANGGILFYNARKLKDYMPIVNKLKDDSGIFALDMFKCIFVSRSYIYGHIVSCHKRALVAALNQNKPLIMYIAHSKAYYKFEPKFILENNEENIRKGSTMCNFDIKFGRRIK